MNGTGKEQYISAEPVPKKFADHSEKAAWGYTYFVRRGDAIKIGHSAIPKQRISQLQVAFPEPLEVLAIIPNTIVGEADAHAKFAHLRMSGEWFRAGPELLDFIQIAKVEAGLAPKQKSSRRVVPKVDPLISKLHRLRSAHGTESPVGYHCSNLTEIIPAYKAATDPVQRAFLAASAQRQMVGLTRLRAGLQ